MNFIIEIRSGLESYTLQTNENKYQGKDLWLQSETGEGLTISESQLFKMLDQFFKDNF